MKLPILLLTLSASSLLATRFEFVSSFGERPAQGEQGTAFIETTAPTGQDVSIPDAIASFQFRNFDSGTNGIYPDLPNIIAPLWDSLEGFTFFGTMTWTELFLTGVWSMRTPNLEAPEHSPPLHGVTNYRLGSNTLESFWPLEYSSNQSSLPGKWEAVPETGSLLVMFMGAVIAMFGAPNYLSRCRE